MTDLDSMCPVALRAECRICRDEEDADQLLSPCLCSGSVGYIHFECLVKCIESRNCASCDICLASFEDIETRTFLPSFGEFLKDNQEFQNELIFAILMAVLLQASFLCQFFKAPQENCIWLQAFTLVGFVLFYAYYMLHFYHDWAEDNMRVQVVNKRNAN